VHCLCIEKKKDKPPSEKEILRASEKERQSERKERERVKIVCVCATRARERARRATRRKKNFFGIESKRKKEEIRDQGYNINTKSNLENFFVP
jgi:hypothetical protein